MSNDELQAEERHFARVSASETPTPREKAACLSSQPENALRGIKIFKKNVYKITPSVFTPILIFQSLNLMELKLVYCS